MEVLSETPEIISISQDHVPERLQKRTLIFYIKECDCVVLAGWGEHTTALAKLIKEYLEIPAGNYGMIKASLHELELPGMALEIYRVLNRIYQERNVRDR